MTMYYGITAHRGDNEFHPENTLPAFDAGIRLGVDWLELDVRRTVDGILVVHHDSDTARTTGSDLKIAETRFKELRKLDYSVGFRKKQASRNSRFLGIQIPTLAEVLQLVKSGGRTRVSIQPKTGDVPEIVSVIYKMNAESWIGFNDTTLETVRSARQLMPKSPIFLDISPGDDDLQAHIETALEHNFQAIVFYWKDASQQAVKAVRRSGVEVGVWTLNDPGIAQRMSDWGVSRFYTDCPGRFLSLSIQKDTVPIQRRDQ